MARNKYERTFMLMAWASENTAVLDLTNPSSDLRRVRDQPMRPFDLPADVRQRLDVDRS